jgi:hypothetical protein
MQHFRVRIFGTVTAGFDLGAEMFIDVADYRHVPDGPGVLLVSHDGFYNLEANGSLVYTRRSSMEGSATERLQQAYIAAANACARLENEPEFAGKIQFETGRCEVSVNDRLLAPNNAETRAALEPVIRGFFESTWGTQDFDAEPTGSPRDLVTFTVSQRVVSGKKGGAEPVGAALPR